MADLKISQLTVGTPALATDMFPANRSGSNVSLTTADILSYGSSPITGTTITATTRFLAPEGSAASPGYDFTNSTAGIVSQSSDSLGFVANSGIVAGVVNNTSYGFQLNSTFPIGWTVGIRSDSNRTGISEVSAGVVGIGTGAAGSFDGTIKAVAAQLANANGQILEVKALTELTTIAAAATTDTTIQMPANSVVLAVDVRVTTVIPTATTFTVGDSGSAARFSTAAVSVAANSTDSGTKAGAYYNASALAIRITPNGTPADNTGRVRVTIHYYTVTPATS